MLIGSTRSTEVLHARSLGALTKDHAVLLPGTEYTGKPPRSFASKDLSAEDLELWPAVVRFR